MFWFDYPFPLIWYQKTSDTILMHFWTSCMWKQFVIVCIKYRYFFFGHRMTIEKRGKLTFCHTRDQNFDVNDYLLELKGQLKTWRDVYWRIWGMINYLTCTRCKEVFPCSDFGHCKYHPEPPRFDNETGINSCIGTYPCCHLKTLRFDPTQQNKVVFFLLAGKVEFWMLHVFQQL